MALSADGIAKGTRTGIAILSFNVHCYCPTGGI
jgi:hypothetical protein